MSTPFYNQLKEAMEDPKLLPEGGNLVFKCRHFYANDALAKANDDPQSILKGADALVFSGISSFFWKVQLEF